MMMHDGQRNDDGALYRLIDASSSSSDDPRQNGTPTRYLYPLSTRVVAVPAGVAPAPALAVGLLALLWVWVLDGEVLPLWVRRWARGRAAAKGVCRCRVCTLRMQARSRPLHDVSTRGMHANKALKGWS